MFLRWIPLCVLVLGQACQAPLAKTLHDIEEVQGYRGTWKVSLLSPPAEADAETAGDESTPERSDSESSGPEKVEIGQLEISESPAGPSKAGRSQAGQDRTPAETGGSRRTVADLFRALVGAEDPSRLVIRFTWTADPDAQEEGADVGPAEPIRFDAQLIRVDDKRFLTVQRFAGDDWLDPWSTPLQRTLLLEESDDGRTVTLSTHEVQLLWSPTPFAGEFRFDPDSVGDSGRSGLVQTFDDLLEFYAAEPLDRWTRVLAAERMP